MAQTHLRTLKSWLGEPGALPFGWCHGLAGYLLAIWECAQVPGLGGEASAVLSSIIQLLSQVEGSIGPSSCHGAAGIVEALDVVSCGYEVNLVRQHYQEIILDAATSEQSTHKESGATALMCGLAGIGATVMSSCRPFGVVAAPWHMSYLAAKKAW